MKFRDFEEALHLLMGTDYTNCYGATKVGEYLAFYHSRVLYSVESNDAGIISLVFAKNPYEAIEMVDEYRKMKALEYRIPKKPKGDYHSVPHYRCPTCNCTVKLYEDSEIFPFCSYCGQKLDWSEVENESKNND